MSSVACTKTFSLEITGGGAPCDLGEPDNTLIANSAPDPGVIGDTINYGALPYGDYEFAYTGGAFQSDDNPCPAPDWKIVQYQAIYSIGTLGGQSTSNLVTGASYCGVDQGDVETQMMADPTATVTFNHCGDNVLEHKIVSLAATNVVSGSPNPTWAITRTKKLVEQPPAQLRIVNFGTVSPALVGCSSATSGGAVWDGSFPNLEISQGFIGCFIWRPDFSFGLSLNGKALDSGDCMMRHSGGPEPTVTGCAWLLEIVFDSSKGSWYGVGPSGYSPVGVYTFEPLVSDAAFCDLYAAVRAATTVPLPANTRVLNTLTADAAGALPAIDGITLAVNDRLLVKDEVTGENRGLYKVDDVGSAVTLWSMTRTTDADTSGEVTQGIFVKVTEGATNGSRYWRLTTQDPITLNTTSLTWTVLPVTIEVEAY
jgi:hypothetical protein